MDTRWRVKKFRLTAFWIVIICLGFLTLFQLSYVIAASLNYAPTPFWLGKFSDVKNWKVNNWNITKLPSWGSQNIRVLTSNSTNGMSPHGNNYLRILYPSGSANSGASPPLPLGGAQFYGAMIDPKTAKMPITLSFYIRFPTDFPFSSNHPSSSSAPYTLGKLPGLYGGVGNTGRNTPTGADGWTTRYMWCDYVESTQRKIRGGGQLLLFTKGSDKGLYGHDYGKNLGCGNWRFSADGKWHNLQQTVYLNDPGVANGRLYVCYDGNLVLTEKNIMFRTTPELSINGILFQSFFGGSGAEYATPKSTYVDFADFALYSYPTSRAPGTCISNP